MEGLKLETFIFSDFLQMHTPIFCQTWYNDEVPKLDSCQTDSFSNLVKVNMYNNVVCGGNKVVDVTTVFLNYVQIIWFWYLFIRQILFKFCLFTEYIHEFSEVNRYNGACKRDFVCVSISFNYGCFLSNVHIFLS